MRWKKILMKYFLKYLFAFLLVFISSIFIYNSASDVLKRSTISQFDEQNTAGIAELEGMLSRMRMLNESIQQNSAFLDVVRSDAEMLDKAIKQMKLSNDQLFSLATISGTPYVFSIMKNNDAFLSTGQISLDFNSYYRRFLTMELDGCDLSNAESVKERLFEAYQQGQHFLMLDSINYTYGDKYYSLESPILYLAGSGNYSRSNYLICFVIDRDMIIQNMLLSNAQSEGFVYIRGLRFEDNLVKYGSIPEEIESSEMSDYKSRYYHIIQNNNNKMGWDIVTGISYSLIQEEMRPTYMLLMMYLILGMSLVVGLTLIFSISNYRGFHNAAGKLSDSIEEINRRSWNDENRRILISGDYGILAKGIENLKKSSDQYQIQVQELKRLNEVILLEQIITLGIHTEEEKKIVSQYFDKEPDFFCVAVVRIICREVLNFENFTLELQRLIQKYSDVKFVNVHSGISDELYLFQLNPEREANVNEIRNLFKNIIPILTEQFDTIIHVGISSIGTELKNINRCYEQANQIVRSQYIHENENIVSAYNLHYDTISENLVNLDTLNKLYNLLVCNQRVNAQNIIEKVVYASVNKPYQYEIQKAQVFYSIRNVFYTVWLHYRQPDKINMDAVVAPFYNEIKPDEMGKIFCQAIDKICCYIEKIQKSNNRNLQQNIIDYLNKHSNEHLLTAYTVSSELGISEKYLYQFIKEHTGYTFTEYLLKIRIDHAKEYLENTDYSNEKIAELSGFTSVNTFYRNFSKIVGLTPKTYKDKCVSR